MANSSSPFKSYDIRGLVGSEITPTFAEKLGRALVEVVHPKKTLIGYDMRETSPVLAERLIAALLEKGVDCIDIGLCTTTVFYDAIVARNDVDLGVMVTASHNPAAYNGFKLCRQAAVPIGSGSGMEEIERAWFNEEQNNGSISEKQGACSRAEGVVDAYLDKVFERLPDGGVALKGLAPGSLKIVVDTGNGMSGLTLPALTSRIPGLEVIPMYYELDGTFPNHEANPLHTETLDQLRKRVVAEGAMAGFAFDGDGDRMGAVDEKGDIVPGDLLTALLSQQMLLSEPNGLVLYDLRSSWSVREAIEQAGGRAEMCRVGHAHIKRQMREKAALFAGELAMHFYFSNFGYCEASEYAMLLLLNALQVPGTSLSSLWRPLLKYAHSGERNFRLGEPAAAVLERVKERYASLATSATNMDGLRHEFCDPIHPENDWWLSVRASNTEPLLRLNLEARNQVILNDKVKELECVILGGDGAVLSTI